MNIIVRDTLAANISRLDNSQFYRFSSLMVYIIVEMACMPVAVLAWYGANRTLQANLICIIIGVLVIAYIAVLTVQAYNAEKEVLARQLVVWKDMFPGEDWMVLSKANMTKRSYRIAHVIRQNHVYQALSERFSCKEGLFIRVRCLVCGGTTVQSITDINLWIKGGDTSPQ